MVYLSTFENERKDKVELIMESQMKFKDLLIAVANLAADRYKLTL